MRFENVDPIDQKILAFLEENARRPNSEIAREVGLAPVTVGERISRMRDTGLITKFTVNIDPGRLGRTMAAIMEFEPFASYLSKEVQELVRDPAVRACYKVTGQSLLILLIRVKAADELNQVILRFNEHGKTHSSLILSSELDDRPWFAEGWPTLSRALVGNSRGY